MKIRNMDVVYIVRPGDDNEELRYSLRSIDANLAHARVVIAGYKPDWVKNVYYIATDQTSDKYTNAANNWAAAMADPEVTEDFIAMNDDFYVMQELQALPVQHRGLLEDVIGYYAKHPGPYIANMRRTRDLLKQLGCDQPYSYALHTPMVMKKHWRKIATQAAAVYGYPEHKIQMRTLYGNLWRIGGEAIADVKTSSADHKPKNNDMFLSSNDASFSRGIIGDYIREQFKVKSKYER